MDIGDVLILKWQQLFVAFQTLLYEAISATHLSFLGICIIK
jgi:hypothetical protein